LDFSHDTIVKTFNLGYNVKSPDISKYCYWLVYYY
jgi:hypothetical protein